jgi:hypothetical protein
MGEAEANTTHRYILGYAVSSLHLVRLPSDTTWASLRLSWLVALEPTPWLTLIVSIAQPSPNFLDTVGHPNDTRLGFITSCLLLGAFAS